MEVKGWSFLSPDTRSESFKEVQVFSRKIKGFKILSKNLKGYEILQGFFNHPKITIVKGSGKADFDIF